MPHRRDPINVREICLRVMPKSVDLVVPLKIDIKTGKNWGELEVARGPLLSEAEAVRPDLTDVHKKKLQDMLDQLGSQELVTTIQQYLNTADKPRTDGLENVLLSMKPSALPALCTLLGDLQHPAHQGIIANALVELAKATPAAATQAPAGPAATPPARRAGVVPQRAVDAENRERAV